MSSCEKRIQVFCNCKSYTPSNTYKHFCSKKHKNKTKTKKPKQKITKQNKKESLNAYLILLNCNLNDGVVEHDMRTFPGILFNVQIL